MRLLLFLVMLWLLLIALLLLLLILLLLSLPAFLLAIVVIGCCYWHWLGVLFLLALFWLLVGGSSKYENADVRDVDVVELQATNKKGNHEIALALTIATTKTITIDCWM